MCRHRHCLNHHHTSKQKFLLDVCWSEYVNGIYVRVNCFDWRIAKVRQWKICGNRIPFPNAFSIKAQRFVMLFVCRVTSNRCANDRNFRRWLLWRLNDSRPAGSQQRFGITNVRYFIESPRWHLQHAPRTITPHLHMATIAPPYHDSRAEPKMNGPHFTFTLNS